MLVQEFNKAKLRVECDNANPSLSPANETVAKRIYPVNPVNPVNPVQCSDGGPGRKLRQDEQDGQDAEMRGSRTDKRHRLGATRPV